MRRCATQKRKGSGSCGGSSMADITLADYFSDEYLFEIKNFSKQMCEAHVNF